MTDTEADILMRLGSPPPRARNTSKHDASTPRVPTPPPSQRRQSSRFSPFTSPTVRRSPRRASAAQQASPSVPSHRSAMQDILNAAPPSQPLKEKQTPGRRRNEIWEYHDSDHEERGFRARCKLCKTVINNPKPSKKSPTSYIARLLIGHIASSRRCAGWYRALRIGSR
jgi:hypothetical protein